jgi:hypothetical protein
LHKVTHRDVYTLGITSVDEGLAPRRFLYLTTHNIHKKYTSMPPAGFELGIPVIERPQTKALETGIVDWMIGAFYLTRTAFAVVRQNVYYF